MTTQYGFFIDSSRCTGCKTCELACKDFKDLGPEVSFRRIYEYAGGDWQEDNGVWVKKSIRIFRTPMSHPIWTNSEHSLACHVESPGGPRNLKVALSAQIASIFWMYSWGYLALARRSMYPVARSTSLVTPPPPRETSAASYADSLAAWHSLPPSAGLPRPDPQQHRSEAQPLPYRSAAQPDEDRNGALA